MRKRNNQIILRLTDEELAHFRLQVKKTELSQEAYIRMLIMNLIPKETPPIPYYDLLRQLHAIGNNLNQIAHQANAGGELDAATCKLETESLRAFIRSLQQQLELPERLVL